jgi:NADP-reducing hydrogenase subunit HndB
MGKIKNIEDLKKLRDLLRSAGERQVNGDAPDSRIRVRVAMATCGIASGAREVLEAFREEFSKRNIEAIVTQTGCMGYCYAEPTVEITLPGHPPVTFGYVDARQANRIIDRYILNNELVEGIIPVSYETIGS